MTWLAYVPAPILATAIWLSHELRVLPDLAWKCELELWIRDVEAEGSRARGG